jgi:hypothetical protein
MRALARSIVIASLAALSCACGLDVEGSAFPASDSGVATIDATTHDASPGDSGGGVDSGHDAAKSEAARFGLVASGRTMKSTSYTIIATLGEGPADQRDITSPSYHVVGGIVGATQAK